MAINLSRRISAGISSLIRNLCTAAAAAKVAPVKNGDCGGPLNRRLSAFTLTATGKTATQTLDEYVREGKVPRKDQLVDCIKELRKFRHYQYALEIMEWIELRHVKLSHRDHAVRLDLISKVS